MTGSHPYGPERMRQVLSRRCETSGIPGVVAGVSRNGDVDITAAGTMAVNGTAPMTPGSIFRITSMTKPITAVAAMTLVEDCVLRLDDRVDDLLPELADRRVITTLESPITDTVPARRPITVRDLLTFTAGYGMDFAAPGEHPVQDALAEAIGPPGPPRPAPSPSVDEWMARLGEVPLFHQPGQQWMYNTPADILGVLIQRASGKPLESYLRERVLDPLGMTSTGFTVPARSAGQLTTAYLTEPDGSLSEFDPADGSAWLTAPGMPLGAAGLVSTVGDLLAFGQMMLNGGAASDGERVLSRPFVDFMTSDQLTPAQRSASTWVPGFFDLNGWGLGLAVITSRQTIMSIGTFGWDGGGGTSMYMDPQENLTGVLLTQAAWTSPAPPAVREEFWTTAYAGIGA